MSKRIPVSGRFGKLVIVGDPISKPGRLLYPLACDCGGATHATSHELRMGKVRSCGCVHVTHGETVGGKVSPEYTAWRSMLSRCYDTNDVGFPNYGGRGIAVCQEWRASFAPFLEYMGRRPTSGHSVDRINSAGNYEPGNVRWATAEQQNSNKRNVCMIAAFGETHTISEWSRLKGVPFHCLWRRLRTGWIPETALTKPLRKAL